MSEKDVAIEGFELKEFLYTLNEIINVYILWWTFEEKAVFLFGGFI